jgi:hypothetical protein
MSKEISRNVPEMQRGAQQAIDVDDQKVEKPAQYRLSHLFLATTVVASILSALVACRTTYETHGAVPSGFVRMGLAAFLFISCGLFYSRRYRRPLCVVVVIICATFSYRQAVLSKRLRDLKFEVSHVIVFLEQYNNEYGKYPADLTDYKFHDPSLTRYVDYITQWYSPYAIRFHTKEYTGIGYWYYAGSGEYYFEDD